MYDYLLIIIGIFILILIIAIFILLGYIYSTYKTYTLDIDRNLSDSEYTINNTSKAFNKLQDNVVTELAKITDSQNNIIADYPKKTGLINSNLLKIFDISSNLINYESILTSNIIVDNINIKPAITTAGNITSLTDKSKLLHICDNATTIKDRKCISLNVDEGIFNIYTSNSAFSGGSASGISIRNTDNSILAKFDTVNKNIFLGSDTSPAISVINNIYIPNIIVGSYSFISEPNKILNLSYISNFLIKKGSNLNFLINDNNYKFTVPATQPELGINYTSISYASTILKLIVSKDIAANIINNVIINVNITGLPPSIPITTNGYITLS